MFEVFESGASLSKKDYKARLPELRAELLHTQFALQKAGVPVLIIVAGAEGAGKGEVVNRLNSWMDTRFMETSVFTKETDEEAARPFLWRFWRKMPAAGQIGVFFGSWYTRPITRHVFGELTPAEFDARMNRIRTLEQMLVDGGMVIVKCWLHICETEQRQRFEALEKDERTQWRVSDTDWRYHNNYATFLKVSSSAIPTHRYGPRRPWHILDAFAGAATANIAFMETLLHQLETGPAPQWKCPFRFPLRPPSNCRKLPGRTTSWTGLNLSPVIGHEDFKRQYKELILEIEYLAWQCYQKSISSVFVFEGWDAAGKGGVIRRLIPALDAKLYRVKFRFRRPTLHREKPTTTCGVFWQDIPAGGRGDHLRAAPWYGRVLVERVEGFATLDEWSRSYHEINEFEQQLIDHGTIVNKFWLHISDEETTSADSKNRQKTPYKQHKIHR